jgi:hypothetical protein
MLSSKKLTCKGILRQVFICLRPITPYLPPLHTVFVYTHIHTRKGGEGGGQLNQREGSRGNNSQKRVENTDCATNL